MEDDAVNFTRNPFPWTERANVIYLESPGGVGYSTAKSSERTYNDYVQADDAFAALKLWFDKFPEYLNNSIYIAGESYGGIYAPYLTWEIYQHNILAKHTGNQTYNLAGMMVGNGATDWDFDVSPSFPEAAHAFNIIPKKLLDKYNELGCTVYFNEFKNRTGPTTPCNNTWM